jgi:excisionase family DNA binding protein
MYSVKEAAQKMKISDSHLRRLLESGQVEGKKLGHDWVVLSLDYKRKRKPRRRAE